MALRTPPLYLQAGSHSAENDRLGIQGHIGRQGVGDVSGALPQAAGGTCTGDFAVTQSGTPGMTVSVAGGWAWVLGTTSATQGMYQTYNDAPVTLTIITANASLPRIDRVVLTIRDAAYAGSSNDCILQVITGTANASPTAPAIPASSLSLATIAVGAAVTSILNTNITDTRTRAAYNDVLVQSANVGDDSLTLQAITSQTGNLLAIRNASGTLVNGFDASGALIGAASGGAGYQDIFLLMGA